MIVFFTDKVRNGLTNVRSALPRRSIKLRRTNSTRAIRPTDFVINWGSRSYPSNVQRVDINPPEAVEISNNKLSSFEKFEEYDVSTVPWTTDREVAQGWIADGKDVFARTLLNSHGGGGIVLCNEDNNLVDASLYTQRVKARKEFRVHVLTNERNTVVIDIQQKKRRLEGEYSTIQGMVRSYDNGWVFCRDIDDIVNGDDLNEVATKAVQSLGLNLGAVDVIYNEHYGRYYVLEVNSAPGIEGTTAERYANCITAFSNLGEI